MRRLADRFPFPRWPVRWRLAAASAALTLVILVAFAITVGRLVGERMNDDFDKQLREAAGALAAETNVSQDPFLGPVISSRRLHDFGMPGDAAIRIVDSSGQPLAQTPGAANLGPPSPEVLDSGPLRVASAPIPNSGPPPAFVQYARSDSSVTASVDRLWLFLAAGVLGGTLLAALAGLALADRAMRPIASLTARSREIATTRDPSLRLPEPTSDDEVAELSRTLSEMLRSLDEARAEREQTMERQREFVADASHELRTPLTSVLANLELLQASVERDSDDEETVESALRSSRRMARLVSDLLLLARADAGRRSARTSADLGEIVASALREVEPVARGHQLKLKRDGAVEIDGNPDELHRLALNLIDNAVRHTSPESTVEVRVGLQDGSAVLEVADDGPGIPPKMREQVFERFVRGTGPADVAGDGGSGLGLAIVRAVAESHGGSVEASLAPTGGAQFTVRIPLKGSVPRREKSRGAREDAGHF
jgi:two-component system OmpR family sensor kinase